jgi:hypothetical protein
LPRGDKRRVEVGIPTVVDIEIARKNVLYYCSTRFRFTQVEIDHARKRKRNGKKKRKNKSHVPSRVGQIFDLRGSNNLILLGKLRGRRLGSGHGSAHAKSSQGKTAHYLMTYYK